MPNRYINIQKIKYGKWETPEPEGCLEWDEIAFKQCSVCKQKQFLAKVKNEQMDYCPHCGAKMMKEF